MQAGPLNRRTSVKTDHGTVQKRTHLKLPAVPK